MTTQYNNVICVQWMVRARFHGVGAEVIDKQNEEEKNRCAILISRDGSYYNPSVFFSIFFTLHACMKICVNI